MAKEHTVLRVCGSAFDSRLSHHRLSELAACFEGTLVLVLNGPERPFRVQAEHGHAFRAIQSWLKDRLLPSRVLLCLDCFGHGRNRQIVLGESSGVGLLLFFVAIEFVDSVQEEMRARLTPSPQGSIGGV